ncbi:MAG TPA: cytochrome P450 [Novosphingobium sp.]|nr:cytochrome P450 [Novosphingobium sp.]
MPDDPPLPAFRFQPHPPSLWQLFRQGIGDVGSCIPEAILRDFAVQLPGPGAPLVLSHPDLAREVLNDRAGQFERDKFIRRLFRRSWGEGLAGAEGPHWERQRKASAPFFTPGSVKRQLQAFARETDGAMRALPDEDAVELNALALRIVARIVFSVLVEGRGAIDPEAVARDVPGYIARVVDFGPADLLPLPERLLDWLNGVNRDPQVRRVRAAAQRLAQERGNGPPRSDLIALLEGIGPVGDNIGGLIPAALDTTVHGLSWALNTLALRPEWQSRLAEEARAAGPSPALEQLPLTRRVVQEVLRLYAPAPLLARSAGVDQVLAGHSVRRGQTVIIAVYAMHRHPRLWDDPDRFDPDRFLPEHGSNPGWMPFGTGPRMCIAAQFAQAEMAVMLARILAQFALHPSGHQPDMMLRTATRSRNGLVVRLQRR